MNPENMTPIKNAILMLDGKQIEMIDFVKIELPEGISAAERLALQSHQLSFSVKMAHGAIDRFFHVVYKAVLTPREYAIFRRTKKWRIKKKYRNLVYKRLEAAHA